METVSVAIVGAGPYGLSAAAALKRARINPLIFGVPMQTWKEMPEHLFLRSKITPAFNPFGDGTFGAFLEARGIVVESDPPPISRNLFLDYAVWFLERTQLAPIEERVVTIAQGSDAPFVLETDAGRMVQAERVIIANGLGGYEYIPDDLAAMIPARYAVHSAHCADLSSYSGKRVLIVGGRQAGLEWSALLAEAGSTVDTVYRHETPAFKTPDWEILKRIVAGTLEDPAWFKHLEESEREEIVAYVRPAAKRQVEPWLAERVIRDEIHLHPHTKITKLVETPEGFVEAHVVEDGTPGTLGPFSKVIWATGYKPQFSRIPFFEKSLAQSVVVDADGYPVLNESFESSVSQLHFTGLLAEKAFGPLMGFMNMCDASAKILARAASARI